jgi:hypothetical protein
MRTFVSCFCVVVAFEVVAAVVVVVETVVDSMFGLVTFVPVAEMT